MTAEIAILNRGAVALAADSAVTIGDKKVFNSVNKLFSLSKKHPVGIMIYGNAEVMRVPWETVIKLYREHLGARPHETLDDYANDFIAFLREDPRIFPKETQDHCVRVRSYIECQAVRDLIIGRANEALQSGQTLTDTDTRMIAEGISGEYLKGLETSPYLPGTDESFHSYFVTEFKSHLEEVFQQIFEKIPQNDTLKETLFRIVSTFFSREIFVGHSGIVIAGFGRQDIYPKLRSFQIGDYIRGTLKWRKDRTEDITATAGSSINPFAQSEMVYTFALGIDPEFDTVIRKAITSAQSEFTEKLVSLITPKLNGLPDTEAAALASEIRAEQNKLTSSLRQELEAYQRRVYIDPLHETVSSLPGPELAAMAESLVNLTSFKRRMSMDKETVGGPVDVALITKGDGLIWMKRKHHFDAALNPQFFANYNRRDDEEN